LLRAGLGGGGISGGGSRTGRVMSGVSVITVVLISGQQRAACGQHADRILTAKLRSAAQQH
jgi:hypothetical protein